MIKTHAPNELQLIPIACIAPSDENCRLFIEPESLDDLIEIYTRYEQDKNVVLPDAPIVRFRGWHVPLHTRHRIVPEAPPRLELLAGERRLTAASMAGCTTIPCRVVTMTDEEAYRFILRHNNVAGLSTVELAFRAAEMDRLGFSTPEIELELVRQAGHSVSVGRYLAVGKMIDRTWFTDTKKQCNPSIVEWFEAACYGKKHFKRCFIGWDRGVFDADDCSKTFRNRGKALPLDNAEKGFRVTYNGSKLVVRGQIDLDVVTVEEADSMLLDLITELRTAYTLLGTEMESFGEKSVVLINPDTV